ncbi:MAG TPA: EAL domain-containing protein [Solirubrobacteraceae bacterium]|nr:EAL domain-containing protein [Solirubrobacteraceae bacterium]
MALLDGTVAIERDDHILRARRTAAITRAAAGLGGITLILVQPSLLAHPALGIAGFSTIALTALVHLWVGQVRWLRVEESLAGAAAILIVGLQGQRVTALSILWLVAISTGVMARGGRVHWVGRSIVLTALALPVILEGRLSAEHTALCLASLGLLLTSGRLTRELNYLLRQARHDADNAETLLLAGDIASRVARRGDAAEEHQLRQEGAGLVAVDRAQAEATLTRLIAGEGLSMAVQPIVDVRTGAVHAYEALARFAGCTDSPLRWFSIAAELGARDALERACLRAALSLFRRRPAGAGLSVNLSVPVLLDPLTLEMLDERHDLEGLIIEITEGTLAQSDVQLQAALAPLRERGARLAVDDMGAGYSGLRQITTVHPNYLKLDRSLISGIDHDQDRAALVGALVGYSNQVGSLLVAEGIEHRAELRVLGELGVPLAQGYYTGRPGQPWPKAGIPRPSAAATAPGADMFPLDAGSGSAATTGSLLPA